jgi:hypothetical protein
MKKRLILVIALVSIILMLTQVLAESGPIYQKCRDHPRDAWCYEEEVERIGDPELCENILVYWPVADGVHGWCLYRLALKKKDCSLCDRIKKADIRKLCIEEMCT